MKYKKWLFSSIPSGILEVWIIKRIFWWRQPKSGVLGCDIKDDVAEIYEWNPTGVSPVQ